MNNYIPSGTSLFDVLSMIIPGGLIIGFAADSFGLTMIDTILADYNFFYFVLIMVMNYLIGIIWSSLMDLIFRWLRMNKYAIFYTSRTFDRTHLKKNFLLFLLTQKNIIKNYPNIKELYIAAYYKVIKTPNSRVVIILETQVAFIRNMIFITLAYGIYLLMSDRIIAGLFECHSQTVIGISLIVMSVLLFFTLLYRQYKIYYLIWEGEYNNRLYPLDTK